MELLEQLQKWVGQFQNLASGGSFGVAVYCALKIYEQRTAAKRGERSDDRDDRKQDADLIDKYMQMNLALMGEVQEYRQKFNDCEEANTKLTNQVETLTFRLAQLETVLNGVEWIEGGHVTPDALRAAADRQEQAGGK